MRYQNEANYIIYLLKCAINNDAPKIPDITLDWNIIYQLAKKHKITSTLYFSIIKLPKEFIQTIPHINNYISSYKRNLVLDANRSYELERLKPIFNAQQIDYVFLKGSVIKNYYPDTSMRRMSDIDILFRGADFKTIDKIFENLGYKILSKGAKDTAYINPVNNVKIEMQPHLIDMGYSEWYQYLEKIWDKCPHENHEYKLSLEDFYIYHIIHMAKHFVNGGIGLTHVLDIYIMDKNFVNIDWIYVNTELSKIGLDKFNNAMRPLADYWFHNGNHNGLSSEQLELIETYIISGGAFGSWYQHETNAIVSRGDKKVSIRKKFFPNIATMVNYYGEFLNAHRFLLPLYWMRLNITRLFRYDIIAKKQLTTISSITESHISKTKEIMDICGLK